MSRVNIVADHEGNSAKGKEAHRQRNQVEEPFRHLKTEDENVHHEEHRLLDAVLQNLRLRQEVVVLAGQRILRPRSAQPSSHHIEDGEKIGQSREEEQFEGVEEAVRFGGQIFGQLDAEVGVKFDVEGDGDGEQEEGGAHADGQVDLLLLFLFLFGVGHLVCLELNLERREKLSLEMIDFGGVNVVFAAAKLASAVTGLYNDYISENDLAVFVG